LERGQLGLGVGDLSAALVGRAGGVAVGAVIRNCVDPVTLVRVQNDVIAGRRAPEYYSKQPPRCSDTSRSSWPHLAGPDQGLE
jgi:hypothetical protein